jgi:hypothetical protein
MPEQITRAQLAERTARGARAERPSVSGIALVDGSRLSADLAEEIGVQVKAAETRLLEALSTEINGREESLLAELRAVVAALERGLRQSVAKAESDLAGRVLELERQGNSTSRQLEGLRILAEQALRASGEHVETMRSMMGEMADSDDGEELGLLKMLVQQTAAPPEVHVDVPETPPVAYRFTVKRDAQGRIEAVTAEPL